MQAASFFRFRCLSIMDGTIEVQLLPSLFLALNLNRSFHSEWGGGAILLRLHSQGEMPKA
ncbi:hypothetical protein AS888_06240 [Peribacillus simplex]|uniref:Uncharacterized protein n=1 Tax=Peribacillus simplex TaxID=1478 RepID=A0A120GPR0_9BACI|nr:hypothetical protein AS888_06240 [Peribacillus simplex]